MFIGSSIDLSFDVDHFSLTVGNTMVPDEAGEMKVSFQLVLISIILVGALYPLEPYFLSSRVGKDGELSALEPNKIAPSVLASSRALDFAEWMDNGHTITVDGDASDWATYTPTGIGTGQNQVNLYMANDNSYLYICADALSDNTDNEQVNDRFEGFFDGENDNDAAHCPDDQPQNCNENSKDSWFILCGDRDRVSDQNGAYNDGGLINRRTDTNEIVLWYNQQTWIDEWGYQWHVGFSGNPAHMVYEIKIPFTKWNWHAGDQIGAAFQLFKAAGGNPSLIGKYPGGYSMENLGTWKDIHLATRNDRPFYSNPKCNPSTISNDGVNETLLTVEATDPDGTVSHVRIDISDIGGGTAVEMCDDGTNGDDVSGDGTYSYRTTVSTSTHAGTYELPFTVTDDHTPNIGIVQGTIRLTVTQANRAPFIKSLALDKITLGEDEGARYLSLNEIFEDSDQGDVLTYLIETNDSWDSQHLSSLADYRVLLNDTIKINPVPDKHGSDTLVLKAKDAKGLWVDRPHSVTVIIQPTNDPPRIEAVNDTEIVGQMVALTAYEDRWTTFLFETEDIDNDPLEYEINISDAMEGISDEKKLRKGRDYFFYKDNGTLKLFPQNSHVGVYYLELTVDDENGGTDSIDIVLSIANTNDPPVLSKINTMHVEQDDELEITPKALDDDLIHGDTLTFSTNFSEEAGGLLTEDNFDFDEETGEFYFTPDMNMVRTYYTCIRVEDDHFGSFQRDFKIIVINTNDPPEEPDFSHVGGENDLNVTFTAVDCRDPDNDELNYQWEFGDGEKRYERDLKEITHAYAKEGNYLVTLTLSDGYLASMFSREISVTGPDDTVKPSDRTYLFSGTVTDENNEPLKGAEVRIELLISQYTFEAVTLETGEDGAYSTLLPPGNFSITITHKDHKTSSSVMEIRSGDVRNDVEMEDISSSKSNGSERGSALSNPVLLGVLVASVVLALITIVLIILIKKRKKQRDEESATPHHITPSLSRAGPPIPPSSHPGMMPPEFQYKSLPPGPPVHAPQSPPRSATSQQRHEMKMPVGKRQPDIPKGKRPVPDTIDGKKPQIVRPRPPRPPKFKGKKPKIEEGEELLPASSDEKPALPVSTGPEIITPKEEHSRRGPTGSDSISDMFDLDAGASPKDRSEKQGKVSKTETWEEIDDNEDIFAGMETGGKLRSGDGGVEHFADTSRGTLPEDDVNMGDEPSPKDILKELASDESEVERKEASITGIFDGLDRTSSEDTPVEMDERIGTLAKIPVKRIAISKESGEELKLCDICNDYYSPSKKTCPHCGGRKKKEKKQECPSCGNMVASKMIFCNKCGSNLRKVKAKRVDTEELENGDMTLEKIECQTCGKLLHSDMQFCNACGTPTDGKKRGGRSEEAATISRPPRSTTGPDVNKTGERASEHVECYQCGNMIPVTTSERPTIVTCEKCGTPGQLL